MEEQTKQVPPGPKPATGLDYLILALDAFLGLGMDVVLAVLGNLAFTYWLGSLAAWQSILHWVLICLVWVAFLWFIVRSARRRYGFDALAGRGAVPAPNWLLALALVAVCVLLDAISHGGVLSIVAGWRSYSRPDFFFQYLYYFVEIALVLLMVVFGQEAGETWFAKGKIPWGGIYTGLTWGLVHALTKGSLLVGLEGALHGLLYGCIYLLVKKDARIAYPMLAVAFIL